MAMQRSEAVTLLQQYAQHTQDPKAIDLALRVDVPEHDDGKVMRWLGYIQGVLVERGVYSLEEVKHHASVREVSPPAERPNGHEPEATPFEIEQIQEQLRAFRDEGNAAAVLVLMGKSIAKFPEAKGALLATVRISEIDKARILSVLETAKFADPQYEDLYHKIRVHLVMEDLT